MEDFFDGLSKDDQKKYERLYKEYKETEDQDKRKKYLPHLIILREKGKLGLLKKGKRRED